MGERRLHEPVLRWYSQHARDLPWRAPDRTAWGVLVSEVMLQQTPVARVLPVWHEWLQRWPTPIDLAAEPPGEAVRAAPGKVAGRRVEPFDHGPVQGRNIPPRIHSRS